MVKRYYSMCVDGDSFGPDLKTIPFVLASDYERLESALRKIAADHWDIAGCGTIRAFAKRALEEVSSDADDAPRT
jgi:hypothetical protein